MIFYARPWSAEILAAIEDHWRGVRPDLECSYITHQLQSAQELRALGRPVTHIPQAIESITIADPVDELQRIERRYGDALLPLPRYVMAERFFRDRDRAWQVDQLVRHALFFERLFDKQAPALLIGESPDIMPAWLAYDMAPFHGCEPVGMIPSTLPPEGC